MQPDPHLHNGEEIQWQGSPDASVWTTRSDSMLVPFSVFTLGFAIFWTVLAASSTRGPRFMWVFGLVFIAFALYMVIGRFFVKAARKRRTHYFLTNKRAIVIDPAGTHYVGLATAQITSSIRSDGAHLDVTFGMEQGPASGLPGARVLLVYANTGLDFFAAMGSGLPIAFYDVADVTGLEEALAAREST
ncbi:hypothetical protein [Microbacterium sp. ZW T5_56]|uniref:hypothetical protein n=1 Tax=Microbacterium sp. ZW T5_56 TaxID=3378081 RepID=UPI0038518E45